MKTAKFAFEVGKTKARLLAKALLPESTRGIPRTKIKIFTRDNKFLLSIQAEDTSALRAAINSWLRWIGCAIELVEFSRAH